MPPKGSEADVTIKIPRPLYAQLKQVIGGSGFHSVTEFIVYVLRDLMSHHAEGRGLPAIAATENAPGAGEDDVDPLSADEIEAIRKRLTSLGYL